MSIRHAQRLFHGLRICYLTKMFWSCTAERNKLLKRGQSFQFGLFSYLFSDSAQFPFFFLTRTVVGVTEEVGMAGRWTWFRRAAGTSARRRPDGRRRDCWNVESRRKTPGRKR